MNEQSTHKDTERHAREWRDEFSSGGDRIGEQGNEAGYPGTVPAEDRRAESAPDSASGHLSEGISGDVSHGGHPAAETPDNPEQESAPVTSATLSPESFSDVPPDMAGGQCLRRRAAARAPPMRKRKTGHQAAKCQKKPGKFPPQPVWNRESRKMLQRPLLGRPAGTAGHDGSCGLPAASCSARSVAF